MTHAVTMTAPPATIAPRPMVINVRRILARRRAQGAGIRAHGPGRAPPALGFGRWACALRSALGVGSWELIERACSDVSAPATNVSLCYDSMCSLVLPQSRLHVLTSAASSPSSLHATNRRGSRVKRSQTLADVR
jgi:hypothetical protein